MLDLKQDYFELFQIERSYQVEKSSLDRAYRELQQVLHPDRFANAGDRERMLSVQAAAFVNEAYRTLKDPIARGRYLLDLLLGEAPQEEPKLSPMFLMEQMELREAVAESTAKEDPLGELDQVGRQVKKLRSSREQQLAELINTGEGLQTGYAVLQELQFLNRIQEEINAKEAEIEDALY